MSRPIAWAAAAALLCASGAPAPARAEAAGADRAQRYVTEMRQAQAEARDAPPAVRACFNRAIATGSFADASEPLAALRWCAGADAGAGH